jgi:hypothetical protein
MGKGIKIGKMGYPKKCVWREKRRLKETNQKKDFLKHEKKKNGGKAF